MKRSVRVLSLLVGLAVSSQAQAPANDTCAGAIPLLLGANAGTTALATAEGPACGTSFAATVVDVFYSYTPAVDEACTLTLTSGSVDRGAVFAGSCGALVPISCTATGAMSTTIPVTWRAQAGVTYTIRLGRVGATGAFSVTLSTATPLANDDCATPISIVAGINPSAPTGLSGDFFTNVGATTSVNPGSICVSAAEYGAGAFDVCYQYVALIGGPTVIQTCLPAGFTPGTHTDTNLQVFTGSCGSLTQVVCDTDSCTTPNFGSSLTLNASAGTIYTIRLSGFSATGTSLSGRGTYYLTVTPPPANDNCSGAFPMAIGPNDGTTSGATASAVGGGTCAGFTTTTADTWHTFAVAVACTATVSLSGAGADQIGIYSTSNGSLCSNLTAIGCGAASASALCIGGTYAVRVGQTSTSFGAYSVDLQCVPVPSPANDECVNAAPAVLGPNSGTTFGATLSPEPFGPCSGFAGYVDTWHLYVPSENGTLKAEAIAVGGSAPGWNYVGVYDATGGCGGASLGCPVLFNVPPSVPATAGVPLLIRVSSYSPYGSTAYTLTLTLTTSGPCHTPTPLAIGTNGPFNGHLISTGFSNGTPAACTAGFANADSFFSYTADCDATLTMSVCGDLIVPFDPTLSVYSDWDCGSAVNTPTVCNDDFAGGQCGSPAVYPQVTFPVSNGVTYLVRVGRKTGGFQYAFSVPRPFTVVLSRQTARLDSIGVGCATGAPPTLSGSGPPAFGTTGSIMVTGQPNAAGALYVSEPNLGGVYETFGACTIYLALPSTFLLMPFDLDPSGFWTLTATFPAYDPSLDCDAVDLQAVVFGTGGVELTNALRLVFGT